MKTAFLYVLAGAAINAHSTPFGTPLDEMNLSESANAGTPAVRGLFGAKRLGMNIAITY